MSRMQSQIPRLKPAASYGNLSQLVAKSDGPRSLHGSRSNLNSHNAPATDRISMINTPTPVTHRRMYHNHNLSRPPWAIDDTISPFDREPEKKPKNINHYRMTQSEHEVQPNNFQDRVSVRVESPSALSEYIQSGYQRDLSSPFENESYYKSEIQRFVHPLTTSRQASSSQTDLTGSDLNFILQPKNESFRPVSSHVINKSEKRLVLPLKELKRSSHRNNLTYKVSNRPSSAHEPVDFNKVFNAEDRLTNHSDDDIQSRIDYWLNKNIVVGADKSPSMDPKHQEAKKPIFRNQITFTPRPISYQPPENGNASKPAPYSPSPKTIEAVFVQSDSESDKDYIVASKSIESRPNRPSSHFQIRANLASNSRSSNNEDKHLKCEVCSQHLQKEDQMNYCEIRCHKTCFKCFWCKKKLSLNNYKINIDKLCCPLHFRLLSN